MASSNTLKLKKAPARPSAAPAGSPARRPVRPGGIKPPRPTLAEAQAQRESQRPRAKPARRAPRDEQVAAPPPSPPRRLPAQPTSSSGPSTSPRPALGNADAQPRLSKRMTELGLASRREADEWIERGLVTVDGVVVDRLGARVARDQTIAVDRRARQEQAHRVTILLHKPLGIVSGQAEDGHRPAVALIAAASRWAGDKLPQRFQLSQLKHLVPAGRLDADSTGLLVLTQDGRVAKALIGARTPIEKEYVVHVAWNAPPDHRADNDRAANLSAIFPPELLARLRHGLHLDGVALQPAQVSWQNEQHLRIVLREGRKRQIRRMCELVGLRVLALKRIRIGRVHLGALPPGQWRYLAPYESF